MTQDELQEQIDKYLDDGGEITRLKYADKTMLKNARRIHYHKAKALDGSERSQKILEQEQEKEVNMIFSRTDRMRVDK